MGYLTPLPKTASHKDGPQGHPGGWCNGNTAVFGTVVLGSSPSPPAIPRPPSCRLSDAGERGTGRHTLVEGSTNESCRAGLSAASSVWSLPRVGRTHVKDRVRLRAPARAGPARGLSPPLQGLGDFQACVTHETTYSGLRALMLRRLTGDNLLGAFRPPGLRSLSSRPCSIGAALSAHLAGARREGEMTGRRSVRRSTKCYTASSW